MTPPDLSDRLAYHGTAVTPETTAALARLLLAIVRQEAGEQQTTEAASDG